MNSLKDISFRGCKINESLRLKVKYLQKDLPKLKLPSRDDVGIDIYSAVDIEPLLQQTTLIPTGIALEIPEGYWVQIVDRSSKSKYYHVLAGIVDGSYRGQLFVRVYVHTNSDFVTNEPGNMVVYDINQPCVKINKGDKIAQIILHKNYNKDFNIIEVDELSSTDRGELGFGSTGK